MINLRFNTKEFAKEMNNIVAYSEGFLEGVQRGRKTMMENFAGEIKESFREYVDSMARVNPQMLHHVYEWEGVGDPSARLFEINCQVSGDGISASGEFRQSTSVKRGSRVPFFNKAEVMERGMPVTIRPVQAEVLSFKDGIKDVFVKGEVSVQNPGGAETTGGFARTFDEFFGAYFSQVFLLSSNVWQNAGNPVDFARNLNKGKNMGRSAGITAGQVWIERSAGE